MAATSPITERHGLDRVEVASALERLDSGARHDPAKAAAAAGLIVRPLQLDWAELATLEAGLPVLLRLRDARAVVLLELVRSDRVTCTKLLDPL